MGTKCVQGPQQNNYDAAIQEPCPQQIRVLAAQSGVQQRSRKSEP